MNMFLDQTIFVPTELAHLPVVRTAALWKCDTLGLCVGKSHCFDKHPLFLADENFPSDMASRNRRDRWHYYHFHALSCEPIAP